MLWTVLCGVTFTSIFRARILFHFKEERESLKRVPIYRPLKNISLQTSAQEHGFEIIDISKRTLMFLNLRVTIYCGS
jgi:hypothetical protein